MRDDTKQERDRKRKRKQHESGEHEKQHQESVTTITKDEKEEEQQPTTEVTLQQQQQTETKDSKTKDQHKTVNIVESNLTTIDSTDNTNETTNIKTMPTTHTVTESNAATTNSSPITTTITTAPNLANNSIVTDAKKLLPEEIQTQTLITDEEISLNQPSREKTDEKDEEAITLQTPSTAQTQTSNSSLTLVSATSASSSIVTAMDFQQRDPTETYDDDVFYDARSEDSGCTAASSSMASNTQQKQEQKQEQQQQQQQQQQSYAETKCQQSEQEQCQQKQPELQLQQQGHEASEEKYLKNPTLQQQDTNDEGQQQEQRNLEVEGQPENEQQQQQQQPPPADCHKTNEPLQQEQQMNKNEVKKKNINSNSNSNNKDKDKQLQCQDNEVFTNIQTENDVNETQQQLADSSGNSMGIATIISATTTACSVGVTTANPTSSTSANSNEVVVTVDGVAVTVAGDPALELKVNKHTKKKQEINEFASKNELETTNNNNDEVNFITKDNDKAYKGDKRETKRISKHKRDYLHEEERRENRLRNQQQQHEDEKPTTTVITSKTSTANTASTSSSATKKHRSQRRSPSSSNSNNYGGGSAGGRDQTHHKIPTSTLSCDTCCQLEWQQHDSYINTQQQQHSPQTLKPPTLHIGMAGQPTRVSKRKTSSSSCLSRERASKTKQEIKTKIIYSQEKPESTTTRISTSTRETGITTTVIKINKTKATETETKTMTKTETEKEAATVTCSAAIKSTNVAATKPKEEEQAEVQQIKEELIKESSNNLENIEQTTIEKPLLENPDILQEIKEISKAIATLQHDAETSDSLTLEAEKPQQHVEETKIVDTAVEEKLVSTQTATTKTNDDNNVDDAVAATTTSADAATTAAAATATAALKEVSVMMMDQQTTKEAVDVNDAAAVAMTAASCTLTANDSKTNTTNISCNSEFAGVTTHSPHNSSSPIVPLITTLQSSLSQESELRRPPLQRQDYSCLDSSEAQSDDSHLTRDSVTRESQNDELSSSTLDKIDVSTLPLPALPPKKRRTKLRASPSKHHHGRTRHDSPQKHQQLQQQELRDPHGSNETTQLTVEETKHLSAFQQYVAKRRESLEASTRSFNEKLESRRMHYHMGGGGGGGPAGNSSTSGGGTGIHMPTYLFGEQYYTGLTSSANRKSLGPSSKEEIYLNKSGWVQVNTKRANDENRGYRRANYNHQNGDLRNTIRVIQIDNTRRSDMARQALLQHQHSMMEPPKFVSSKVEELIQRNEARLGSANTRDSALRPGYRIVDPQLASILNERPGFLPVKNLNDHDSPPPITPILSPPPAFQDSSAKVKSFDRRRTISSRPTPQQHSVLQPQAIINNSNLQPVNGGNNKGMVFSRSFEYDNRRPTPTDAYVETFSRSFDGNLTERVVKAPLPRDRSPNFSTLTGNSPNYLTKKDSGGGSSGSLKSRESSPKYQSPVASISSIQSPQNQKTTAYLNTSVKEAPPSYSVAGHANSLTAQKYSPRSAHNDRSFERSKSHNVLGRSRKSQFSRSGSGSTGVMANSMGVSRFRSFDTTASQRLNSCDSGARSDLSNDELDNEEDDAGSSEFLNTNSYHPATSPFKTQRQRSLTPDRNESHSSSSSLRKQRSITPESRSLTPEDRRKKGSQVSLSGSRQNSSSRSNTLERKHEKVNISRSSSSSSYSGREHDNHGHSGVAVGGSGIGVMESGGLRVGVVAMNVASNSHRRSLGRNAKQADEHRIRRSRSLQLTERSPNRGHKMVVCVGQNHVNTNQPPLYQQSNIRNNLSNMQSTNFPPTIRTTGKSQSILINNSNGSVAGAGSARHRQSDIDKSRSFDFDYCNYNAPGNNIKSQHSNNSLIGTQNLLSREAALRLEFDKSRSFDEDYREAVVTNNNLNANAMRYLQANENSDRNHVARIRRSSPVEGNGRNTRSPQSSGSSCNNLSVPRSTTSPQNYGTRLCDHEMTYDLMRKSLDRSPIMDFRRGDSAGGGGGDYDIPMSMLRNRETINSGGNSELNFMNSDNRQYEHMSSNSLKQQRSLRRTHSPNESHYSLERTHNAGSRDDITPNDPNEYRNEYNELYRRTRSNNRGRYYDLFKSKTTNVPLNTTITTTTPATTKPPSKQQQLLKDCSNQPCSYWPQCGACHNLQQPNYEYLKSLPLKRQNTQNFHHVEEEMKTKALPSSHSSNDELNNGKSLTQLNANISSVKININTNSNPKPTQQQQNQTEDSILLREQQTMIRLPKSTTQWTLLCKNALASTATPATSPQDMTCLEPSSISSSNTVVNVKSSPLVTTKLTETTATVTATTATVSTPALISSLSPSTAALTLTSSIPNTTKLTQPRVIPLAATSLVFLGDFEMPITRDRNDCTDIYETKTATSSSGGATTATSTANTIDNNFSIYETKLQDNVKRISTNEKQTRKFQTNKFKHKNAKMMMMRKIMENDGNDFSGGSTTSSSISSSCNESSITSSCGSGNSSNTTTPTTTVSTVMCRKRKNMKVKAKGKAQRYCRRPRMSLPNIWLNGADQNGREEDDMENQQQRYETIIIINQRQHQYQQQRIQIPSSSLTIDHHLQVFTAFDNSSSGFYHSTNIKHYIGINASSIQQQNIVIREYGYSGVS
ncbi:uncharacterized protein LOC135955357 [Calliphora vicina]|uniref:uncharacterized protein LOC135955357 n=1 Tax=Calliphora vicina TaxID=7373 RepID=UPI00325B2545